MGDAAPDNSADSPSTSSKPEIRQTAAEGAAPTLETDASPTDAAAAEAAQAPRAKPTDTISGSEPHAKQPPPREVAGAVPSRAARAGGSAAAAAPAQSAAGGGGGGGGGGRRWARIVGAAALAATLHVLLFAPELRALGWLPLPLPRWSRGHAAPVAALPCSAPQLNDACCIAQAPSDGEGRAAAAERAGAHSSGTVVDPWRAPEDVESSVSSSGGAERRDLDVFEAALHQLGQEVHTLKRHAHTNAALPRALYQIEVRVTAMEAALRTAAAEREQSTCSTCMVDSVCGRATDKFSSFKQSTLLSADSIAPRLSPRAPVRSWHSCSLAWKSASKPSIRSVSPMTKRQRPPRLRATRRQRWGACVRSAARRLRRR
ncbi:hypothetical protein JKP88DRAFT_261010 [Tribonema minus]|uniref:Uncharacterized protein n=1 Tax=Tribonema minus TaxID=303371 RepID=A0A836CK86_9STRA|nr:hypothetical protein JKP88DRAFT_261010 [Tribonema minus]